MGTSEDLLKDICPDNNKYEEFVQCETDESETGKTLKKLVECQKEIDGLGSSEFRQILQEIQTFDKDYKSTLKELFQKRNKVISNISGFWINAITNNPKLPFVVNEHEISCIKYLMDLNVEELKDDKNGQAGFIVSFTFLDNPYLENNIILKMFSWKNDGIIVSSNTPITWKKISVSNPLHEELLKTMYSGRYSFFEWLTENEGPKSINFLQILELWHDPLRFYSSSADNPVTEDIVSNSAYLEEAKKIQDGINMLTKVLDDKFEQCTSHVGEGNQEIKKTLYLERNRLIKNIPNFWSTVLINHPDLSALIGDDTKDCLQYLTNIDLEESKDPENLASKMKISFHFAENNPYMSNTVISKEFNRKDGKRFVTSTPIDWKNKKQDEGDGNAKKDMHFFDWFNDDSSPEALSHITLPVLQLWDDPVQYYLDACYESDSSSN